MRLHLFGKRRDRLPLGVIRVYVALPAIENTLKEFVSLFIVVVKSCLTISRARGLNVSDAGLLQLLIVSMSDFSRTDIALTVKHVHDASKSVSKPANLQHMIT